MVEFSGNILILGCGSVAQCVLPLLLKHLRMPATKISILDFEDNRKKIELSLQNGVQYIQKRLTPNNFHEILKNHLLPGDICLDLAWNLDTIALIDWCHYHGIHYLNTSLEVWQPFEGYSQKSPTELTLYSRHMALHKMMKSWKDKKGPTAIIDHGANPGLVSHFTKQALLDLAHKIIENLSHPSKNTETEKRKKQLYEAIAANDFPQLAYLTNTQSIHISERDSQITKKPKEMNEFVNSWSVTGFIEEGLAPAEMGWGTHEKKLPVGAYLHNEGPQNQICLSCKGINTWVRSWVPSGEIIGMVIRHGEAFSISDYLTIWKENKPIYRPTVHYAYCPCDSAMNSLHELKMRAYQTQTKQRILSDDIIAGSDELGCLLMGHDFKSWWIGSILDIQTARKLVPGQNATTVQVAAGIISALTYIIKHPSLGVCLPDQLNHKEILEVAKPYLGQFISKPVNWSPYDSYKKHARFNHSAPHSDDEWQFSSFLL